MARVRQALLLSVLFPSIVLGGVGTGQSQLLPPTQLVASYNDEQSVTLRWQAVAGARYYRFQISDVRDFSVVRTDALVLQARSWIRATVAGLEPGKEYWWRVQSLADGSVSQWSLAVRLRMESWSVEAPDDLVPPDGATLAFGRLQLSWRPCENATSYRVQVSPSPRFDSDVLEAETVQPWVVEHRCVAGKLYYWRVCSKRGSQEGQWSQVQRFQLLPLSIPRRQRETAVSGARVQLISGQHNALPLMLTPNLAADQLTIASTEEFDPGSSIVFYDVQGRSALEQSIRSGERSVTIAVGHLPQGSYTLHVAYRGRRWIGTVELLR
ncbi:MAG: hypothetical protein D6747_05780 [Chlorobiota bacterium]|jgi:hypothetical protein|nr:MAG: hypothetical protein D6747_05780 [Chlorobiota bacterium]